MRTHLRNYVTSALLALPAAVSLVAAPTSAMAQPATPEVRSLEVGTDAGLDPGARLRFRLVGTPRVQASVRVRGVSEAVPLREVSPGVYIGGYTVKRADRLDRDAEVRAMLRRGNRIAAATYTLSETMAAPVVVAPAPPPPPAPRVPDPRIERFGISPLERIEPGADIRFALEGTPGGTVVVDLPGVANDLRLREVRPGFYEGSYTIRRSDNFNPNRPIVATLRVGDRVSTTNVPFPTAAPVAVDNRPPNVLNLTPREGETVPGGPATLISGNFEDRGGSGVDPASVQIVVSGRNVTRDAQISTQGFSFRDALPAGRHTVEVTARDRAGNVVRRGWSFDVAGVVVAPVNVGVQVLNHGHNSQVGPGPTLVEARTAPRATVAVSVHAVAPTGGGVNISQNIYQQTLQADPDGNFGFTFVPQIPIPGTRYDIVMVSSRGNANQETRLSLFQR
ncbi:MAG: hypothetical protein JWQ33_1168 [Ramlibacter sp.]|nr:hypothetical protein [Ramlibacter sp.]